MDMTWVPRSLLSKHSYKAWYSKEIRSCHEESDVFAVRQRGVSEILSCSPKELSKMDWAGWCLSVICRNSLYRKNLETQSSSHSSHQRERHSRAAKSGITGTYLSSCGSIGRSIDCSKTPGNKTAAKKGEDIEFLQVKASPDRRSLLPGVFIKHLASPTLQPRAQQPISPLSCRASKGKFRGNMKVWYKAQMHTLDLF